MDLHHLKLFYVVARNLSFSKSAEELHISQPAISMQIKALENELGLKLIERSGRSIFLTKEGQLVYNYTQKIFLNVNELESEINILKGKMSGKIRIGASNTPGIYILPEILGIFKNRHPDVILKLDIGNTLEIQEKMLEDELDFAIIGGDLDLYKIFVIEKLIEDTMVVVASPLNPISNLDYIDSSFLSTQYFIAHDENSLLFKAMEKIMQKLNIKFNIVMNLGSVEAIKNAVAANLGITFMPLTAVYKEINAGTLKRINIENKVWKYPFSLVYHGKKTFSEPSAILIKMIRNNMKELLI